MQAPPPQKKEKENADREGPSNKPNNKSKQMSKFD